MREVRVHDQVDLDGDDPGEVGGRDGRRRGEVAGAVPVAVGEHGGRRTRGRHAGVDHVACQHDLAVGAVEPAAGVGVALPVQGLLGSAPARVDVDPRETQGGDAGAVGAHPGAVERGVEVDLHRVRQREGRARRRRERGGLGVAQLAGDARHGVPNLCARVVALHRVRVGLLQRRPPREQQGGHDSEDDHRDEQLDQRDAALRGLLSMNAHGRVRV